MILYFEYWLVWVQNSTLPLQGKEVFEFLKENFKSREAPGLSFVLNGFVDRFDQINYFL